MTEIDPDAPLRLATVAKLAFPDGSMGASGLLLEAKRVNSMPYPQI